MPAPIGSLFVSLLLEMRPWGQQWAQAESVSNRALSRIQTQAGLTNRAVAGFQRQVSNRGIRPYSIIAATRAFEGANERVALLRGSLIAATTAVGGFTAALSSNVILRYADTFTILHNQLRVTARGVGDLEARFGALSDIAQRSRSGLRDTTVLFSRLAKAQPNRDPEQLLGNVQTIQKALQLGGATVQEAASAAIQFSQAIASNRLGGEELRAILETPLGLELARGLGVTIGQFRELARQGALTSDVLLASLDKVAGRIDTQFASSIRTFDQAVVQADNRLIEWTGKLDKSLGATRRMGDGVIFLAENLETLVPVLGSLGLAFAGIFAGRAAGRFANFINRNTIGAFREFGDVAKAGFKQASEEAEKLRADLKAVDKQMDKLAGKRIGGLVNFAPKSVAKALAREQEALDKLDEKRLDLIGQQARKQAEVASISAQSSAEMVAATDQVAQAEARLNSLLEDEQRLRNELTQVRQREIRQIVAQQNGRPFDEAALNQHTEDRKRLEREIGRIQADIGKENDRLAKSRLAVTKQVSQAEQAAARARIAAQAEVARLSNEIAKIDQQHGIQAGVVRRVQGDVQAKGTAGLADESGRLTAESARLRTGLADTTKQMTAFGSAGTVAARSMGVLRAAGSNLVGFLGGPWGIVFIGAIGLLTAFGISAAKTAERARRVEGILDRVFERRSAQSQPEAAPTLSFLRISKQIDQMKEDANDLEAEFKDLESQIAQSLNVKILEQRPIGVAVRDVKALTGEARGLLSQFAGGRLTVQEFRQEFEKLGDRFGVKQEDIKSLSDTAVRYGIIARAIREVRTERDALEGRLPLAAQRSGTRLRQEGGASTPTFSDAEIATISSIRAADALTRLPEREAQLAKARQALLAVFEKETGSVSDATRRFVDEITVQAQNFKDAAETLSRLRGEASALFKFDLGGPLQSEGFISAADLSLITQAKDEIAKLKRETTSFADRLTSLRGQGITSVLGFAARSSPAVEAFAEVRKEIDRLSDGFLKGKVGAQEFSTGMEDARKKLEPFSVGDTLNPFINGIIEAVLGMKLLGEATDEDRRKLERLINLQNRRDDRREDSDFLRAPTKVESGRANDVLTQFLKDGALDLLPERQQKIERKFIEIHDALRERNADMRSIADGTARSTAAQLVAMERAKDTISSLLQRSDEIFGGLGAGNERRVGGLNQNFGFEAGAFAKLGEHATAIRDINEALDALKASRDDFLTTPLSKALGSVDDIQVARSALTSFLTQFDAMFAKVSGGKLNATALNSEFERMRTLLVSTGAEKTFVDSLIERAKELIRLLALATAEKQNLIAGGPKVQVSQGRTEQQFSVTGAGGKTTNVMVTRTVLSKDIRDFRSSITGELQDVSNNTNATVGALHNVRDSVEGTGEKMSESLRHGLSTVANEVKTAISRFAVTSASGTRMSTGFATTNSGLAELALQGFQSGIMERQDALSAEAQVLQTGLQFKNLTAKQRYDAELRLAEIELENAKLQERLADATMRLASGMESMLEILNANMDSFQTSAAADAAIFAGRAAGFGGGGFDLHDISRDILGFGFAGGGQVRGPGGPMSDKVPIMASPGEHVINAEQARKHRPLLDAINEGRVPKMAQGGIIGRFPALAAGGVVPTMPRIASDISLPDDLGKALSKIADAAGKGNARPVNVNVTIVSDNPQAFQNSRSVINRDLARAVRAGLSS